MRDHENLSKPPSSSRHQSHVEERMYNSAEAFHVVFTTHNSRTSPRMKKWKIKKGPAINLNLDEEIALTRIIGEIIRENRYQCISYNICSDHVHLILVCKNNELNSIVQKIKSISSKLFHRLEISFSHDPLEHKNHLWSQKFFRVDMDVWKLGSLSNKPGYLYKSSHLRNAMAYIFKNREKHGLPLSEKLNKIISSFIVGLDAAFEYYRFPVKGS